MPIGFGGAYPGTHTGGFGGVSPGGGGGGGGFRSTGRTPWWVGPAVGLFGGILRGIGRKKSRDQAKEEGARQEAESKERARGKAALIRGILNANGYGGMMTDEQILAMVTKTGTRPNTAGGTFEDIGAGLTGVGRGFTLGNASLDNLTAPPTVGPTAQGAAPPTSRNSTTVDPQASGDFWEYLSKLLAAPPPTAPALPPGSVE